MIQQIKMCSIIVILWFIKIPNDNANLFLIILLTTKTKLT